MNYVNGLTIKRSVFLFLKKNILQNFQIITLSKAVISFLKEIMKEEDLILIYGVKNEHFNQAVVLKEWLEQQLG